METVTGEAACVCFVDLATQPPSVIAYLQSKDGILQGVIRILAPAGAIQFENGALPYAVHPNKIVPLPSEPGRQFRYTSRTTELERRVAALEEQLNGLDDRIKRAVEQRSIP